MITLMIWLSTVDQGTILHFFQKITFFYDNKCRHVGLGSNCSCTLSLSRCFFIYIHLCRIPSLTLQWRLSFELTIYYNQQYINSRFHMITIYSNVHQGSSELDIINYRQSYGLLQWEKKYRIFDYVLS